MRHDRPPLESDFVPRRRGSLDEADGVVEEELPLAHMDKERRQPSEVGIERRGERGHGVGAGQIQLRDRPKIVVEEETFGPVVRLDRTPGDREIRPGREESSRGWKRNATVPEPHEERQREPSPGGFAGDRDPARVDPLLRQQTTIGRFAIIQRSRKPMLGREPVIRHENPEAVPAE